MTMMRASSMAAFVATRSTPLLKTRSFTFFQPATALVVCTGMSPTDYQQAALGFFNGIRFPSTLIAGSSVAALFSLIKQCKNPEGMTPLEIAVLRLYHAISLLQFCCSITAIAMSTSASTLLLLSSKFSNTEYAYSDIYHFLKGDLNFEFVVTRWAFLSSLTLFVAAVASRILLEMDLLKPKRRMTGLLVAFTMLGVLTGIVSNINLTLNCWPNLVGMTKEVLQLMGERFLKHRGPLQLLSLGSFVAAFVCLVKILARASLPMNKDDVVVAP